MIYWESWRDFDPSVLIRFMAGSTMILAFVALNYVQDRNRKAGKTEPEEGVNPAVAKWERETSVLLAHLAIGAAKWVLLVWGCLICAITMFLF